MTRDECLTQLKEKGKKKYLRERGTGNFVCSVVKLHY